MFLGRRLCEVAGTGGQDEVAGGGRAPEEYAGASRPAGTGVALRSICFSYGGGWGRGKLWRTPASHSMHHAAGIMHHHAH